MVPLLLNSNVHFPLEKAPNFTKGSFQLYLNVDLLYQLFIVCVLTHHPPVSPS